jgi:ATP-dependent DNA helicase RecG
MRPEILFPLFAPATALGGVGPRIGKAIERLAGPHVVDLLWHLPSGIIDRRFSPKIAEAPTGAIVTLRVRVDRHRPGNGPRPYRVECSDETGAVELVFFKGRGDYLRKLLPPGEIRVVSGTAESYRGALQMTHPDHIAAPEDAAKLPAIEPIYPLTAGVTAKPLLGAVNEALARAPELDEWLDPKWRSARGWAPWRAALMQAHAPECEADLAPTSPARERIAYDELLANQLALALMRNHLGGRSGRSLRGTGRLGNAVREALPWALTASQNRAIEEIEADIASPARMLRLLHGDVGSGKTIVALFAMVTAVEAGAQACLMAPTEILARQHDAVVTPLCRAAGVRTGFLSGREKGKSRQSILQDLEAGAIDIAIGTHALFQDDVAFKDLGLAVVDEQHRFGVHQRLALGAKSGKSSADMLVMTATPIPRTLELTAYGDMDVSRLRDKPVGRQPIMTRALPAERLREVVAGAERAVAQGARVYWVCPMVAESEALDLAAAEARHAELAKIFGARVGLIHGRLKGKAKDAPMAAFAAGETAVLVATTVIEVGVDVPEATVIVIEHAERFGLAQLHQLRGRVGRGSAESSCVLLYASPLGETARARLNIMRETDDGFRIAEEDLRLRGAGEVLGTRQSGLPNFRIADLAEHGALLAAARDDAHLLLTRDPKLDGDRGQALRVLLYLFERDAAARYLESG